MGATGWGNKARATKLEVGAGYVRIDGGRSEEGRPYEVARVWARLGAELGEGGVVSRALLSGFRAFCGQELPGV